MKKKSEVKEAIACTPELESFLKENRIYGRYVKNIVKSWGKLERIKQLMESKNDAFATTFAWRHASEGHEFWKAIHKKYNS